MTRPTVAELATLAALLSIQDAIRAADTKRKSCQKELLAERAIELWFAAEEEIDKRRCWDD